MVARAFSVIAFVVLMVAPAFGQATVTQENLIVPIDFQITSCSGEVVTFTGESHVLQHSTANDNTGHAVVHINFHLEGTGPSGTRYVVNEHVNGTINSGAAGTFTSEARLVAVAQGSADNLVVHTFIHTTVNANGEVTAQSFEFETDCQG
jgi:hypothetical protein